MGAEAFEAALGQAGGAAPPGPGVAAAGPGPGPEQALQVIVGKTVAVLTQVPEKKGEWWEALGQLQQQAGAQGASDLAAFIALLRQLVEGADPAALAPRVPAPFRQAWEEIVGAIT
jgi:predicted RecB family endonuclease